MNTVNFNTKRGSFTCYKNDVAFVTCLSSGKIWDEDVINKLLEIIPDGGVIVDIGAHIGTHSILYSKDKKNSQVLSFEPQSKIREILELNVKNNSINNIKIFSNGIGHCNRKVKLANNFTSDGYSSELKVNYNSELHMNFGGIGITNDPEGEEIEIKKLDDFNLKDVNFIKIDIEGAEALAIWGAKETIIKNRPILFIEESDKNVKYLYYNDEPELENFSIEKFLSNLNYQKISLTQTDNLYIPK